MLDFDTMDKTKLHKAVSLRDGYLMERGDTCVFKYTCGWYVQRVGSKQCCYVSEIEGANFKYLRVLKKKALASWLDTLDTTKKHKVVYKGGGVFNLRKGTTVELQYFEPDDTHAYDNSGWWPVLTNDKGVFYEYNNKDYYVSRLESSCFTLLPEEDQ